MDPNEIITLTILGGSVYGWFKTFALLSDARPHFHHPHHRRHRR